MCFNGEYVTLVPGEVGLARNQVTVVITSSLYAPSSYMRDLCVFVMELAFCVYFSDTDLYKIAFYPDKMPQTSNKCCLSSSRSVVLINGLIVCEINFK